MRKSSQKEITSGEKDVIPFRIWIDITRKAINTEEHRKNNLTEKHI